MTYFIHVTSYNPVTYSINYDTKVDPERTTEALLRTLGVIPEQWAIHARVTCLVCRTNEDMFEKVRTTLLSTNKRVVVLDTTHKEIGLVKFDDEDLIGFAKGVPTLLPEQVLHITSSEDTSSQGSRYRNQLQLAEYMAAGKTPPSTLELLLQPPLKV